MTGADVTPLMERYRECARHVWNCYFAQDAEPSQDWDLRDRFNEVAVGLFRAYFDWSDLGFRDFGYYRGRISASKAHPHLVGRDALLRVDPGVKVLHRLE